MHVDHLVLEIGIKNLHVKGSFGTAVTGATVGVLHCIEHLLSQDILDGVTVVGLESSEGLEKFDLLLNQKLIDVSQVLQSAWAVRY